MRKIILAHLRLQAVKQTAHSPLASVRMLASQYGCAPRTVYAVLNVLVKDGLLYSIPCKGFFWGAQSQRPIPKTFQRINPKELARKTFIDDLGKGAFHPFQSLPSIKALAEIYQIPIRVMATILADLAFEKIIVRNGRSYELIKQRSSVFQTQIILITRCSISGELIFDSEREFDFIKSVRHEAQERGLQERGLQVRVIGYESDQSSGMFLDQTAQEFIFSKSPNSTLGIIVSTWLMRDPYSLIKRISRWGIPIGVWWEHPIEYIPRSSKFSSKNIALFNLAFGATPGRLVAEHLIARSYSTIGFISPFHKSEWSIQRLEGLKSRLHELPQMNVFEFTDSSRYSERDYLEKSSSLEQGQKEMQRVVHKLMKQMPAQSLDAVVCVNDITAMYFVNQLRKNNMPRPHIVSFDNTSVSDRLQFDSFEFQTIGMVRQMLYFITNPKAELFKKHELLEMVGRVVVKQTA